MRRNMNVYGGVVFSQRVLLALVDTGMSREEAYRIVQRAVSYTHLTLPTICSV